MNTANKIRSSISCFYVFLWGPVVALIFFVSGCTFYHSGFSCTRNPDIKIKINKVAVFGFRKMVSGERGRSASALMSDSIHMHGVVPDSVVRNMSASLVDLLVQEKRYVLIMPQRVNRMYRDILKKNQDVSGLLVLQKVGTVLEADAVLIGYIYRWQERKGSALAAAEPASVGFDLYLVRPDNGIVVWKARFDKTQQSLTENLLDAGMFFKSKGRWLSAKELAMVGLKKMVAHMP